MQPLAKTSNGLGRRGMHPLALLTPSGLLTLRKPANVLKFTDSDDVSDFVGIEVPHGAELDEDSWLLHEYSIILDLLYPEDSTGSTRALVSNEYLGEAKIKINESNKVGGASFHGKISANTWHRVAIVVSHSNETITYYIDGAKVGEEPIGDWWTAKVSIHLRISFTFSQSMNYQREATLTVCNLIIWRSRIRVISDLGGATAAGIPSVETPKTLCRFSLPPSLPHTYALSHLKFNPTPKSALSGRMVKTP